MLKFTIQEFINKTLTGNNEIPNILKQRIEKELSPNESINKEYDSWVNSHKALAEVLKSSNIPPDVEIILECELYASCYRTDAILAGKKNGQDKLLIIELKQWEYPYIQKIDNTSVNAYGESKEHPMLQATDYKHFIESMYTNVKACNIKVEACAYLHNYNSFPPDPLWDYDYRFYNFDAQGNPLLFCRNTQTAFQTFLSNCFDSSSATVVKTVFEGPKQISPDFLQNIEKIITGQPVFSPSTEQKEIMDMKIIANLNYNDNQHHVFVVKGGPGTGKTVLAFNLLAKLASNNKDICGMALPNVIYATKNSQLKNTYIKVLTAKSANKILPAYNRTLNALFTQVNAIIKDNTNNILYDCLIIDEAQRLPQFQGNRTSETLEILSRKSKNIIFLLDDCQKLAFNDIDFSTQITHLRNKQGFTVYPDENHQSDYTLYKAFRTFGSKAHLDWIDHFLGYEHMKNIPGELAKGYDIQVVETPDELFKMVRAKEAAKEHARVLAGLCWHWHTDRTKTDISIDENGVSYKYSWNTIKNEPSYSWATDPETINEVGCVHTVLGQEFDYTGVIIGDDLTFDGKEVVPNPDVNTQFMRYKRSENDFPRENGGQLTEKEIETVIKLSQNKDSYRFEEAKEIVRNHYHVLLTRGRKGCYIYCTDPALRQHLKSLLGQPVIGNKRIGYHYYHTDPNCRYCPSEAGRIYFPNIVAAKANGYIPCNICCKEENK